MSPFVDDLIVCISTTNKIIYIYRFAIELLVVLGFFHQVLALLEYLWDALKSYTFLFLEKKKGFVNYELVIDVDLAPFLGGLGEIILRKCRRNRSIFF